MLRILFIYVISFALCSQICASESESFAIMDTIDLAMIALVTPESDAGLGSEELIEVTMENNGNVTVTEFSIGFQIDEGIQYLEVVNTNLTPGSQFTYEFTETADLSDVRTYKFTLFTSVNDDEDNSNDTICATVVHFVGPDVRISNVTGPSEILCEEFADFTAEVINRGDDPLTSAFIEILLNGAVQSSFTWNGNLETDGIDVIDFTITNLIEGSNSVEVRASLPNGETDENPGNNSDDTEITLLENRVFVDLNLNLDENPEETSWIVRDGSVTIHSGGPYSSGQASSLVVETLCIQEEGCYTLIVSDSGGDGMCCDNGDGFFTITDQAGDFLLISDGQFGSSFSEEFCEEFSCELSADYASTKETSDGGLDGTITIFAENPRGSVEYSIDGGESFQNDSFFDELASGEYDLQVRDEAGCIVDLVAIVDSCELDFSYEVVFSSGEGESDGEIIITAFGGVEPYEYSINGGTTFRPFSHFRILVGGDYTVVVRDADGCEATQIVTVPTCGIEMTVEFTPASGPGINDGTISVNVSNASEPVEYSKDGGLNYQLSPEFLGLAGGTYVVKVRDDNNCQAELTVEIINCDLDFMFDFTPESQAGESDGTITIDANGGEEPYEYSIDGGANYQSESVFTDLPADPYVIVVRDEQGCEKTATFFLFSCELTIEVEITSTSDENSEDGSILIIPFNGFPDYMYSIDEGDNFQSDPLFTGLGVGFYDIVVIDAFGCEATARVRVLDCELNLSYTSTKASDDSESDGSLTLVASDGIPPYQYSIDGGMTFQDNGVFENLIADSYELLIKDSDDCERTATGIVEACMLLLDIDVEATSNSTSNDGVIDVSVTNGVAPLSYSIDGGDNFQSEGRFEDLATGPYFVVVYDADSCRATQSVIVSDCILEFNLVSSKVSEIGNADGQIIVTPLSGLAPYQYALDSAVNFQSDSIFTNLEVGIYTVFILDADGCLVNRTIEVEECDLSFSATSERATSDTTNDGSLILTPLNGIAPYEYSIDSGMTFQSDSSFFNLSGGAYTVVIFDGDGCRTSATVIVEECDLDFTWETSLATNQASLNGSISIIPSGGTPPYIYSIGGEFFQDDSIFVNILPRTYRIVVQDAAGCLSIQEVLLDHCFFEIAITTTPESSTGASDGIIKVSVTDDGHPPFEYSIDSGMTYQESGIFGDLATGPYVIYVRDSLGCIRQFPRDISITTSVFNSYDDFQVGIKPNPFENQVYITIPSLSSGDVVIELYNTIGEKILIQSKYNISNNTQIVMELADLTKGIYLLRVIANRKQVVRLVEKL